MGILKNKGERMRTEGENNSIEVDMNRIQDFLLRKKVTTADKFGALEEHNVEDKIYNTNWMTQDEKITKNRNDDSNGAAETQGNQIEARCEHTVESSSQSK